MQGGICAAVGEDIALGLSLAGLNDLLVFDPAMEKEILRNWFGRKVEEGVSLIILSRDCGEILSRELFDRRISGEMLPITVMIPGEEEDKRAENLIRRAIGMVPSQEDE